MDSIGSQPWIVGSTCAQLDSPEVAGVVPGSASGRWFANTFPICALDLHCSEGTDSKGPSLWCLRTETQKKMWAGRHQKPLETWVKCHNFSHEALGSYLAALGGYGIGWLPVEMQRLSKTLTIQKKSVLLDGCQVLSRTQLVEGLLLPTWPTTAFRVTTMAVGRLRKPAVTYSQT